MQIHRSLQFLAILIFILVSQLGFGQELNNLNPDQILFGVEYTFQDQEMVNEPGRNTMETPHKWQKAMEFITNWAIDLNLDPETTVGRKMTWKKGFELKVPNDGVYVVNPEPVVIEVNTTPKRIDEISKVADVIFAVAERINLVPYVRPAAERSGMGHIHVGAKTIGDSPFYKHPYLLRNLMVYLHQHPSLLYGFSEAFDLGERSNIETYHRDDLQEEFRLAVKEFDQNAEQKIQAGKNGLNFFLKALKNNQARAEFFRHYRYINLEHLVEGSFDDFKPTDGGKLTVELRNFRPPKSTQHLLANLRMILRLMDYLSEPGRVIPFKAISKTQYLNFMSTTKIEADWEVVKNEIGLTDPFLEEQILEYVENLKHKRVLFADKGGWLQPAYSEKEYKGKYLELAIKDSGSEPTLEFKGKKVSFERVLVGSETIWVSVVPLTNESVDFVSQILQETVKMKAPESLAPSCSKAYGRAG